jgi:hypothetical protein
MKNLLLLPLLAFIFTVNAFSQDVIFKKDGSKEEAKIILVAEKEIQYKKFANLDGPVYTMNKKDIVLITYENGDYETIQTQADIDKDMKENLSKNFERNLLTYHMFDLIFGDFAFSYERILHSGLISLKIPIAIGYDYYGNDYYDFSSIFYSGIGVNFYPTGQGKWRYFLGPQVRVGLARESDWMYYYDDYGNYMYDERVTNEGIYTKFFVDNGIMFTPVRNFSIAAIASVGIRYFPEASYDYDVIRPDGQFAVNISYRF